MSIKLLLGITEEFVLVDNAEIDPEEEDEHEDSTEFELE